jgi:hypothetical protein
MRHAINGLSGATAPHACIQMIGQFGYASGEESELVVPTKLALVARNGDTVSTIEVLGLISEDHVWLDG